MKKKKDFILFFVLTALITFTSCGKNEVTNISLSDSEMKMTLGQTDTLKTDVKYNGDIVPSIVWTSSKSNVVKVGTSGNIEAQAAGTAIITAQAGNKTATCTITVTDQILPSMSQGELWYWGDCYNKGYSHNFVACLASSGINLANLSGKGEIMYIELNTDTIFTDSIPSGSYEIAQTLVAGTLTPGYVDSNQNPWGTWYFGTATYNDIQSGIIDVTCIKGTYKFIYNFVDYYGNSVSGSFNGKLPYYDLTKSQQTVKKKMVSKFIKKSNVIQFVKKR
jgi:hypothetical protein